MTTYLDHNATTPVKPAVCKAMMEALAQHGNASSVHRYGRTVRRMMDEARASVAALAGVKPAQVIFTSGGTEANNMLFAGFKAPAVFTSSIEHDSVLAATPSAIRLPVDAAGVLDLAEAERVLKTAPSGSLVSVMLVNNETGVIQPVEHLARLAKRYGHYVHTDAVQAAARMPFSLQDLGVDMLTLSAHKIGGAQGVGALIVGEKLPVFSMIKGGGQEMNRRAGTENVAGIVGFGVAAQLASDDLREQPRLAALRDYLQQQLKKSANDNVTIIGEHAPRVANTLCVALRGVCSETQVMAMDLAGVAVSAGSACSSGKLKMSHVLSAMGYGEEIAGSVLRFSLGWNTEENDIRRAADAWSAMIERIKASRQVA